MLRYSVIVVVPLTAWLHWRAGYTAEVRDALDGLPATEDQLDDILGDVRDRRLIHRCRAVLADLRAGNQAALEEHTVDAVSRIEHLETFAPLRRVRRG